MTKLDDVYMLALKTILNFETVSEIREQGYSRIPVYDTDRSNIVHVLFAKDLMFIDPDDNMPLSMVCEFYQNDVTNVFDVSFKLYFVHFILDLAQFFSSWTYYLKGFFFAINHKFFF